MITRVAGVSLVAAVLMVGTAVGRAQEGRPTPVEPSDLTKRADLVGKEVVVDDRVAFFQHHPDTRSFDQIFLKRCPDVPFDLPPSLRYSQNPQPPAVLVRGVLRRDGDRFRVDVSKVDLLPADLDRLNRAVSTLARSDVEKRTGWARWGERRGLAFKDGVLLSRAREIEAEAIRAESERPTRDPSGQALALAARAREHQVPEPEPSALAHRGFREALAGANTPDDLAALLGKIEEFFQAAKDPVRADPAELARWERPYANDPADAYRAASASARKALDHRLWADAVQKQIERKAVGDPGSEMTLAGEAAERLPDRPAVASALLERGLARAEKNVGALRQSEVETLARMFKEKLNQPERAAALYRAWLDDQRDHRLSPGDAEGRVALAQQYERFLSDRDAAVALLRAAWVIDPQSKDVADAFLRRGYKKVQGEWVEASQARASGPDQPKPAPAGIKTPDERRPGPDREREPASNAARSDSLLNLTPDQVRSQLGGKPNRRSWSFSQGQIMEQWVYVLSGKSQYITFLHKPGETHPRVVSHYSLPRATPESSPPP